MSHPFVFVAHSSKDKPRAEFKHLLRTLVDAQVPLGIDRPLLLKDSALGLEKFVWRLPGSTNDFSADIFSAIAARDCCAVLVVESKNTRMDFWGWREVEAGRVRADYARTRTGKVLFTVIYVTLDAVDSSNRPAWLRDANWLRVDTETPQIVEELRAHLRLVEANARIKESEHDELLVRAALHIQTSKRLISVLGRKAFGGGHSVLRLDQVYSALRGDILNGAEHHAAVDELRRLSVTVAGGSDGRLEALKSMPIMPGMAVGLDLNASALSPIGVRESLATAVSTHSRFVVLGEPGSGKTTLLDWLALRFAEGWIASRGQVDAETWVLRRQVDPDHTGDDRVSLGRVRFPLLIKMADLAQQLTSKDILSVLADKIDQMISLEAPQAFSGHALLKQLLAKGSLFVLLDGLDEVTETQSRNKSVRELVCFADQWCAADEALSLTTNRILVTSRVVGYHDISLPTDWPHARMERMSPKGAHQLWASLFRELKGVDQANAEDAAGRLYSQVFAPERRGLDELAGIPLLATLLAFVFDRGKGALPQFRTELYDRFIQYLIEDWRAQDLRAVSAARWKGVLCSVACHMHGLPGESIVSRKELTDLIVRRLRDIDSELKSDREREDYATHFLDANDKYIGLLVERQIDLFGFQHRTFQEYLAGVWLAEDQELAVERILARWADPGWREAVLLALGNIMRRDTQGRGSTLVGQLLQHVHAAGRFRFAHFIARAFVEMPSLPRESTIEALLAIVFSSFAGIAFERAPNYQRLAIEDSLYTIADRAPAETLRSIASLLRKQPSPVACAVASWLLAKRWRSIEILDALRAAASKDAPEQGFPISAALREALTEIAQQQELSRPTVPKPAGAFAEDPSELEALLAQSASHYSRLRLRTKILRARVGDRSRRWRVDERYAVLPPSLPIPESAAHFSAAAQKSLAWRAVTCGLFGAFGDRQAWRGVNDYFSVVAFVQEVDVTREQMVDDNVLFVQQFGADDPIYLAAVMLDTRDGELLRDSRLAPTIDLRVAHEIVPVPPRLVSEAIRAQPEPTQALLVAARANSHPEEAALFLIAAALANTNAKVDVIDSIAQLTPATRNALKTFAARGLAASADGAYRAARIVANLDLDASQVDASVEFAAVLALDTMARVLPSCPIAPDGSLFKASARGHAEALVYRMSMLQGDDLVTRAAQALDEIEKLGPKALIDVLHACPETATAKWARAIHGSGFGEVWPRSARDLDAPLAALEMIAFVQADSSHAAIAHALPLILLRKLHRSGAEDVRAAIAPFASRLMTPMEELSEFGAFRGASMAEAVGRITDPYLMCLGLVGLLHCGWPVKPGDIARWARRIDAPEERFAVFDHMAGASAEPMRGKYAALAEKAARAIRVPEQRWRAFVRLCVRSPERQKDLLREAEKALERIVSPIERAVAWHSARRTICSRAWRAAGVRPGRSRGGSVEVRRADSAAHGFAAPSLLALDGIGPDGRAIERDTALALYVARVFLDLCEAADALVEDDVATASPCAESLLSAAGADASDRACEEFQRQRPLLSPRISAGISHMAQRDAKAAARLAGLVIVGPYETAVDDWYQYPALAPRAAIISAGSARRRGAREVDGLLQGLAGDDEEIATRAWSALTRCNLLYKRPPKFCAASEMGMDALLKAGLYLADGQKPSPVAVHCFLADVFHDNAALVQQICDIGCTAGPQQTAACEVVRCISSLTPDAFRRLRNAFPTAPTSLQHAILVSCAVLYLCQEKFFREHVAAWLPEAASAMLEPLRFFKHGVADVVAAADEVLTEDTTPIEYLPSRLTEVCLARRVDVRHLIVHAGAEEAMKLFSDALSIDNNLSPYHSARESIAELRKRHGSRAVEVFAHWLSGVLAHERLERVPRYGCHSVFDLGMFLAAELCLCNPSLFANAALAASEAAGELPKGLARSITALDLSAMASCITLACAMNCLEPEVLEAILHKARDPDWRVLECVEKSLGLADKFKMACYPVLERAVVTDSPRAAFIAVKVLGLSARDVRTEPELRKQAALVLSRVVEGRLGERRILVTGERGASGLLRHRGTLVEAAQRELALLEMI